MTVLFNLKVSNYGHFWDLSGENDGIINYLTHLIFGYQGHNNSLRPLFSKVVFRDL